MQGRLPPAPSIFDPDFGSKRPIAAILDRLTVSKAERERQKKDRARERERLVSDRCPDSEKLGRVMKVLEGAANDVNDALADPENTADEYRAMVEELIEEIKRVARWSRR